MNRDLFRTIDGSKKKVYYEQWIKQEDEQYEW